MFSGPRVMLWCQACEAGFGSVGELPTACPSCLQFPNWSTLRPYRLSFNDRTFLKSIRIEAVDRGSRSIR